MSLRDIELTKYDVTIDHHRGRGKGERGERWRVKLMFSPFLQLENENTVDAA